MYLAGVSLVFVILTVTLGVTAYSKFGDTIKEMIFSNYLTKESESGFLFYLICVYAVFLYFNMGFYFYPLV